MPDQKKHLLLHSEGKKVKPLDVLKLVLGMISALMTGLYLHSEITTIQIKNMAEQRIASETALRAQYDYATENILGRLENYEDMIMEINTTQEMVVTTIASFAGDISILKDDVKQILASQ